VSAYFDVDRANALLPQLRETLLRLRDLRSEVVAVRDRLVELNSPLVSGAGGSGGSGQPRPGEDDESRLLHMRLQAAFDQMQAAVSEIDGWGVQLREIETGLVDFPALALGRQIWLCWRLGEDSVGWWHELSTGFGGRRKLEDLV
jgi:hypothetical protein